MFTLFKYLVWLVVSLMFLMLATISISEFLVESAVDAPFDEKLTDYVRMLASDLRADETGVHLRPGVVGLLRSDRQDRIFYAIRDERGDLIAGEPQLAGVIGPLRLGVPSLQNGQVGDEPVRVAAMQVADPRKSGESLTLQVAETLNKRQALTETMRTQAVALPQMLVLVVAILLIVYGYTYVLRPMQRLRALIDNRGLNDLSPLDPDAAPQDLRPLIRSVNGLMERLAASFDAQRRFIADAAHQLRTPLAGIKSQTERALIENDPAATKLALKRLAAGTEHATALANRLLTLARAGTPLIAPPVDVDLIGIVSETIAEHLPNAIERRHDLGFEGPSNGSPCIVRGDALLLREMLSNLIDNALRYSPDGGSITVSIDRDPASGCYALAVSDTGPGIPADERERVFEPFYRGADVMAPGTGLGLAIVRTIATVHGASIALSTGSGNRGLRVTVRFPGAFPLAA
ncbi:MAG TPA: ATP-binding protein [Casimicrobiaceae bacterium]|nr:ATP-binding protein [Casimicrobiaceae bacterium]